MHASRIGMIIVGSLVAWPSCEDQPTPGGPPTLPPLEDAQVAKESKISALAGTWSGEVDTDDFAHVTAQLFINSEGTARYQLRSASLSKSDTLQITFFDGKELRAQVEANDMSFQATLEGDTLRITLPQVGPTILTRLPTREL